MFAVKVSDDLDSNQTSGQFTTILCCEESSDETFETVISGVTLALPLDEEEQEVNPTVIYEDDETFWSATGSGTGSLQATISEELTEKNSGSSSSKVTISTGGSSTNVGINHTYGGAQDWSNKSRLGFQFKGANDGKTLRVYVNCFDSTWGIYELTDNQSSWRTIWIPFTSITSATPPVWNNVRVSL